MKKRSSGSKKALKFIVYGAAAVIGIMVAVASVKKKGGKIRKGGKVLLRKTKFAVKATKDKLNKRQRQMLGFFNREEKITNEMIRDVITGVTKRTIRRDLDFLEEKGYIQQVGKTKGSYYVLK